MVMAAREAHRKKIVEYLNQSHDKTRTLKDIVHHVGTDRKSINQILYALKRQSLLEQLSGVPPVWKLRSYVQALKAPLWPHNNKYSVRIGSPSKKLKHTRQTFQIDPQQAQRIIQFLQTKNMPIKSIDVARHLGFRTSRDINPTLYNMEKTGIVKKCGERGSVMWILNPTEGSQQAALLDDPGIIGLGMLQNSPQIAYREPQQATGGIRVEGQFAQSYNTPNTFDRNFDQCASSDVSTEDPFMGNLTSNQLSEIEYESSQSEPSLNFDQINDARRTLKSQGYIDDESDLTSVGDGTEDDMETNVGNIAPMYQSTPLVTSPENNSGVQFEDTGINESSATAPYCQSDSDMSDSGQMDQVLKGLLKCPNSTGVNFVIAKRAGLDKNEVEDILQKCIKLKHVSTTISGSGTVYTLTKTGETYIKSKIGKVETKGHKTVEQICAPPRNMKKEFTGPPPVPANLVNNPYSEFCNPDLSRPQNHNEQTIPRTHMSIGQQSTVGSISTKGANLGIQDNSGPQPLMSINFTENNSQSFGGLNSTPRVPLLSLQPPSNTEQSNFKFLQRGPSTTFGRGRGRGLMNYQSPSTSCSPGGFTRPPPPVELIRKQLNQTGISPKSEGEANIGISASHVNLGLQKLAAQSASSPQQTFYQQQSMSNSSNCLPRVDSTPNQMVLQDGGPRSLGLPMRPNVYPGGMDPQPQSLPPMGNTRPLNPFDPSPLDLNSESFAALNKNPVSALMEYAQSRHQEAEIRVISQSGPSHKPKFVMGVFIGGKQIAEVTCSNKKDGRKEAADKALRALIASGDYKATNIAAASKPQVSVDKMTHFDKMAALVHRSFNELSASISENFSGRKVIAGLVMKMAAEDIGTVIAIGTGNRCITGPQLSLEGNTVNDSHAEIITRRGFIRFLYKQLMTYNPATPHRLFEQSPTGKIRIKKNITFHLYISTAPCGDGALFSPRDEASNNAVLSNINDRAHTPTFTSAAQGLVRTKMEGGEGTIPVEDDFTAQTFDGIQRGERLRTMSCTDKICRWNVVGMQGALLSHILDPVYLDSLTLGLLYDHGHLSRAICCRLARGDPDINSQLPDPFHLNHPWLGRVTVCDVPRETQKTKAFSVNWCFSDAQPEVTDGTLGLCCTSIEKTLFSRCSKRNLYDSFKEVCLKLGKNNLLNFQTYGKAKQAATEFQSAKKALVLKLKQNNFGTWVSKPPEEEMFS
ncbi:double-stranded RNA-specific adenosine deaminase-like [Saccostrea echinata]|uniref:double-stranded RNA-specific adenosine deaminase-like n=1 Tax=Saccostrea echinata TaxID=191078 RepID=UPI002A7FFD93|nr:double-stranded RNA-specific adenosine deaminase-like [Saccostrea echinata]